MSGREYLGEFEHIVILALLRENHAFSRKRLPAGVRPRTAEWMVVNSEADVCGKLLKANRGEVAERLNAAVC